MSPEDLIAWLDHPFRYNTELLILNPIADNSLEYLDFLTDIDLDTFIHINPNNFRITKFKLPNLIADVSMGELANSAHQSCLLGDNEHLLTDSIADCTTILTKIKNNLYIGHTLIFSFNKFMQYNNKENLTHLFAKNFAHRDIQAITNKFILDV